MDNISNPNEITMDLTEDIKSLNTLRNLKAELDSNGISKKIQLDIDTLILTNFKNEELQKLKTEIISSYNSLETEARTFYGFTYATLIEKNKAEVEYKEISNLKKLAESSNEDITTRKNILNKINNMTFTIKNIAPLLYDVDIACRTFHNFTYNSISEVEAAIHEKNILNEFIKIDEILDETREIYAIINIKKKVTDIKKYSYSNLEIKNYIKKIDIKIEKIEKELKCYKGSTYSSLEYVQTIKDEIYYIETEAYKFDLLSKDGLKFFLELMSLKQFETDEAKLIIEDYRHQFITMEDKEIVREEKLEKGIIKKKKKIKLKIAIGVQIATFIGLIPSIIAVVVGVLSGTHIAFAIGLSGILVFAASLPFCLGYIAYYNLSNGINYIKDKSKSIFK
ncbi:hypothetical protein [uncultured Clostridium sp.]|jgi:hypothetical protein|uniref:hypothetical protein n=1 Tax=uncultured Clostridium sp. TaxID=59620 RepID=UPI002605CFCD|nr:hypothetical protein [uncultured Clostridium sp.]